MKKEKSWTVNVPKLFAINILFTGNANKSKIILIIFIIIRYNEI